VPFCEDCVKRRKRWEKLDTVRLLLAVPVVLGVPALLAATLGSKPWSFWVIFVAAVAMATSLFNRIGPDNRFVRITSFDDGTITFNFTYIEYARAFVRLNGGEICRATPRDSRRVEYAFKKLQRFLKEEKEVVSNELPDLDRYDRKLK
jgi:hypothetical protein